jgi:hypothetical protein
MSTRDANGGCGEADAAGALRLGVQSERSWHAHRADRGGLHSQFTHRLSGALVEAHPECESVRSDCNCQDRLPVYPWAVL